MALLGVTKLGLSAVVVAMFFGQSSTKEGFKQELWLYTEDTNAFYFHTHVPDLTRYNSILPTVTKVCGIGDDNNRSYNATTVKSFRHWAANDTSTDAVSLYPDLLWAEDEVFVTTKAKTDITTPIQTIAATGKCSWMLYEGKNLDEGKSRCYKVPYNTWHFNFDRVSLLNMTTIGSIFKGCDLNEIQLNRESNGF